MPLKVGKLGFCPSLEIWHLYIKVVLFSIPIYTMAITNVPISTSRRIKRFMPAFLWNVQGASRLHWVNWNTICSKEVGLGFHRLTHIQTCLHGKLMWWVLQGGFYGLDMLVSSFCIVMSIWSNLRCSHFGGDKGSFVYCFCMPVSLL